VKYLPVVLLVSLLAVLAAGCGEDGENGEVQPPADEVAVCLEGEPFIAEGTFPLEADGPGDAYRVSGLRWAAHEGCERFVIDLEAEDEGPAGAVGEVTAEVLRQLGVVRVSLRGVEWVAEDATEASFDGELARAAYAVFAPEGRWVYVDLHLAGEAEAHVAVLEDPARVVVDLRPGGGEIPAPAVTEDLVVVLAPRPGEQGYPLTVTGYARTFEANVVVRLEQDGQEVLEDFTTATAWTDAWGHFSFTIEEGPSGPIELHVGDYSAKDGTWEGATIELDMTP
jgi:hypothetical protein